VTFLHQEEWWPTKFLVANCQHLWAQQGIAINNITGQNMDFEWIVLEEMAQRKQTGESFGPTVELSWGRASVGNEVLRQEIVSRWEATQHQIAVTLSRRAELAERQSFHHRWFHSGSARVLHYSLMAWVRKHDQESKATSSSPFPWSHDHTYSRR